jgi:hypothetical protein
MEPMEELTELLKNVSDSYYDFVIGICRYVRNVDNGVQMMIDFIKEHPDAKSDDIIDALETFEML